MADGPSTQALVSETSRKSSEDWRSRLINPDSKVKFDAGLSSFWTSAAKGLCLVDKTLLARDAWECSSLASMVLRPRRFGKSFGLDMINTFYSTHLVQGNRSVTAKEREEFFLTTRLGKEDPDFVREHCGKCPVLLVSLQVRTSRIRCGVLN